MGFANQSFFAMLAPLIDKAVGAPIGTTSLNPMGFLEPMGKKLIDEKLPPMSGDSAPNIHAQQGSSGASGASGKPSQTPSSDQERLSQANKLYGS